MLDKVERQPIRLVGISLSGFEDKVTKQLSLFEPDTSENDSKLDAVMVSLQKKYGMGIIKTGSELGAEQRLYTNKN